jgi:hypothetical protein
MTSSDTLTFVKGGKQKLILFNTTASPVVITIDGSAGTTVSLPANLGLAGSVSVSAGATVTVPASGTTIVNLDDYAAYLQGTVAITGGTGVTAHLIA